MTDTDPTVNDALGVSNGRVGDIKITARTDLGDNWALCNGQCLGTNFPEVTSMLLPEGGREYIGNTIFQATDSSTHMYYTIYNLPQYFCSVYHASSTATYIYVADIYSAIHTTIALDTTEVQYYILGIDWNGTEWVICTASGSTIYLYTNPDLTASGWTLQGTKTLTYAYSFAGWNRLLYNGTGYYLLTGRSSYSAEYLYYFSSLTNTSITALTNTTSSALYGYVYLHRGDDNLVSFYNYTYSPSSPTAPIVTITNLASTPIWKKYNDDYYIGVYAHNAYSDTYPSAVYYLKLSSSAAYSLYTNSSKVGLPFVNKNSSGVWEIYWYYTSTSYYYITLESGLEAISSSSVVNHGITYFPASDVPNMISPTFIVYSEPNENWTRISNCAPYYGISHEVAFAPIISLDAAYAYVRVQ